MRLSFNSGAFNVAGFRGRGPLLLSGGLHAIILIVALQTEDPRSWPWALLGMSVVSFFAWIGNTRRYRAIHDLPTSSITSAAQGYVELLGVGRLIEGSTVRSPVSARPCCWYHYTVEEQDSDNKWKTVEDNTSIDHFLLVDETGSCVVSPDGAEVISKERKSWQDGGRRYTEWLLLPDGPVYAIGEFTTHSGNVLSAADEKSDVSALISEWKNNPQTLLQRFDADRDGQISLEEWEQARLAAISEVRKRHHEQFGAQTEGVHLLRKPRDRRLFLLANEMPDKLGRRYRVWAWVHLIAFLGLGAWGLILLGFK
jgi:hypothetical protein